MAGSAAIPLTPLRGLLAGVTAVAVVLLAVGVLAVRHYVRMRSELSGLRQISDVVQDALLRPVPERCGPLRVHARYSAAESGARVGGDLYEVVSTPFGVRAIIGDVSGHGLAAVQMASDVLGAFRALAPHEPRLEGIGRRLDSFVATRVGEFSEKFVTAVLVEIHADTETAELFSYGHPCPLLLGAGKPQPLDDSNTVLPLGLLGLADDWCPPATVPFRPGDRLVLYTDGAIETCDEHGLAYPFEQRVADLLAADSGELLDRLLEELRTHPGGQDHDDIALLVLEHEKAPSSGTPDTEQVNAEPGGSR
ncbi:PP2C family protein-serine/threonine phosphatase [Actinomadura sp. KC216]|uniref:PP2C family protein-serine/threonine phosphatase n=1 Tax=Actinomadura sp. KC216 TaxID=2530370 RepID=UPI001A9D4568|nr:PP2C family protein-serine/threonine phosphatase [Actinomadura sp. KC216]